MTPGVLTLSLLLLPVAALSLLLSQPRQVWRAGAEHSRWFWGAWVLTAAAVGLAGWARFTGASGIAWLALWCAVGSAQPSMITDLVDVRRLRRGARPRRQPVADAAWVPGAHAG